jgi:hypothetical protein
MVLIESVGATDGSVIFPADEQLARAAKKNTTAHKT